eukprot:COSAG04_NODE_252_length_18819_cov_8.853312_4_plen_794_part_00
MILLQHSSHGRGATAGTHVPDLEGPLPDLRRAVFLRGHLHQRPHEVVPVVEVLRRHRDPSVRHGGALARRCAWRAGRLAGVPRLPGRVGGGRVGPAAVGEQCRHEGQLNDRGQPEGELVVPRRLDPREVVRSEAGDDLHVVVKQAVVADALQSELGDGALEVALPVGSERDGRVAAAERPLPVRRKRRGGSRGVDGDRHWHRGGGGRRRGRGVGPDGVVAGVHRPRAVEGGGAGALAEAEQLAAALEVALGGLGVELPDAAERIELTGLKAPLGGRGGGPRDVVAVADAGAGVERAGALEGGSAGQRREHRQHQQHHHRHRPLPPPHTHGLPDPHRALSAAAWALAQTNGAESFRCDRPAAAASCVCLQRPACEPRRPLFQDLCKFWPRLSDRMEVRARHLLVGGGVGWGTAAAMAFQWSLAALETLMAEDQMGQHAAVLRAFSVVELWRLRRVCRAFHRWGTAALAAQPRVLVVGGTVPGGQLTAGVEVLDLSTLRWSSSGVVPDLPEPRNEHTTSCFRDGRVVVVGGWPGPGWDGEQIERTALQWVRSAPGWVMLPELAEERHNAAAVALLDGRAMLIGGFYNDDDDDGEEQVRTSVVVLAADGSGWSAFASMGTPRYNHVAVALPCGKVLVAGGFNLGVLKTAELWDPATGAWVELPPMAEARTGAGCCVLPSGRVAVVGGTGSSFTSLDDGEVFDPVAGTWQPLPPMARRRSCHGVVAVAGGLVVGGARLANNVHEHDPNAPDELYDEASGRWSALPHPIAEPRSGCGAIVSLPAAALAPAAAGAAASS